VHSSVRLAILPTIHHTFRCPQERPSTGNQVSQDRIQAKATITDVTRAQEVIHFRISDSFGTLPATLTSPLTTKAGVIKTPY
jgi:hypothetical protein